MRFLGLDLLEWTALAAVAGFALAIAAIVTIVVTVRSARADRRHDDSGRQDDRQWDSERRMEDRKYDEERRREDRQHDAELRRQDSERADQLRREDDEKWERRFRAEQRDREDYEARQVTVEVERASPLSQAQRASIHALGHEPTHRLVVSTPAAYPIRHVDAMIAHNSNGNVALRPTGWGPERPVTDHGRQVIQMWAEIPEQLFQPEAILKFVDRHGNLYYACRQQIMRFPQNTDFPVAA